MTNNDDLIRRGDAILAVTAADKECLGANGAREFIAALPAVTPQPTIAAALDLPGIAALVDVGFLDLITDAIAESEKAIRKFPQPNYVILRGEMKQSIAMLYRLWVEGDQVHGLPPISDTLRAIREGEA